MQNVRYVYRNSTQDITKKDSMTSRSRCLVDGVLEYKEKCGLARWRNKQVYLLCKCECLS